MFLRAFLLHDIFSIRFLHINNVNNIQKNFTNWEKRRNCKKQQDNKLKISPTHLEFQVLARPRAIAVLRLKECKTLNYRKAKIKRQGQRHSCCLENWHKCTRNGTTNSIKCWNGTREWAVELLSDLDLVLDLKLVLAWS